MRSTRTSRRSHKSQKQYSSKLDSAADVEFTKMKANYEACTFKESLKENAGHIQKTQDILKEIEKRRQGLMDIGDVVDELGAIEETGISYSVKMEPNSKKRVGQRIR